MKKIIFKISLIIIFPVMLLAKSGDIGYPVVKSAVNPPKATVGVPLEYKVNIAGKDLSEIEIKLPEKREFYPDKKEDDSEKKKGKEEDKPGDKVPLYIIHSAKKMDNSDEGVSYISIILNISYYRPGKYSMPEINIFDRDKIKIGYKIPVVEIGELNKEGKLEEIEPPLDLKGNYYRLIYLVLGVVLLTLIIVFLVKYIRKIRERKAAAIMAVPAIELFMNDLHKLKGERLIKKGKVEDYVFGISIVFRRFLSNQLNIDATEMTSDEINRHLSKILPSGLYLKFRDIIMDNFNLWDLSKFAEFTPSEDDLFENLKNIKNTAKSLSEGLINAAD